MQEPHLPRSVARQILLRAKQGEKAVVVALKCGKPPRVYRLSEYLRLHPAPAKSDSGKRRAGGRSPDPLDAVEGRVLGPIRREGIYE